MRTSVSVKDRAVLSEESTEAFVLFLAVADEPTGKVLVHLPLSLSTVRTAPDAVELPAGGRPIYVTEAERREGFARFLMAGFQHGHRISTEAGDVVQFRGALAAAFRGIGPELASDTSNVLVRIETADRPIAFKSYKLLDVRNREPEILRRLDTKGFRHVPRYVGELALGRHHDRVVLGVAAEHVDAVDLFSWFVHRWREELARGAPSTPSFEDEGLKLADRLGRATAAMHEVLFDRRPGPFHAETFESVDGTSARRAALTNLGDALRRLAALAKAPDPQTAGIAAKARDLLFDNRPEIEETMAGLDAGIGTMKAVTHGDLHLGQVLRRVSDGEILFVDFEGEPARPVGQRSLTLPPLRDVATMVRSFSYVTHYAWRDLAPSDAMAAMALLESVRLPETKRAIAHRLLEWEDHISDRFIRSYVEKSTLYPGLAEDESLTFLRAWMMEKAIYELRYELTHRPANVLIPLQGILAIATARGTHASVAKG